MATRTIETYDGKGNLVGTRTYETDPADDNRDTIQSQANQALAANRAFVASTPTAAQSAAQVKALSRQVNGIIRLLLNQLDGTD